jgi:hypothetical protein
VAITHEPTNDGKARPERNNIAAFSSDGLTWEQHPLGDTVHARALAFGNGVIVAVGQRMGGGAARDRSSPRPTAGPGRRSRRRTWG